MYAVSTETCSLISYGEVHYTTHHRILFDFVVCRRFSCLEGIGSTQILRVTAVHSTGACSSLSLSWKYIMSKRCLEVGEVLASELPVPPPFC